MKIRPITILSSLFFTFAPVFAQDHGPIPDLAQALLDVAYESGSPSEIAAVANAVKTVFPDYEIAIEAQTTQEIAALAPATEENAETPSVADSVDEVAETKNDAGFFAISPWDGKVELSALLSSGNSDNTAIGVLIDAARTDGDFVHNFDAFFNLGSSENILNQKRWGAAYKLDYNFDDRTYSYGRFSYEEDEFSGFDYRLFAGVGLGHYLYQTDPFTWKIEGGPGFRYSPIDDTREVDQQFAAYGASETDWHIREGVLFEQDFAVTYTSTTTTFQSVTSLSTQLWGSISTGVSFEYRLETNPPIGRLNTDTIAKAAVSYGF